MAVGVGLKFAVLSVQIGLNTTLLAATDGNDKSDAAASAAVKVSGRLSRMALSFLSLGFGHGNVLA